MRVPDFVVVGAPKCGTTTLYSHLSKTPGVYVADKEPHYFGKDLEFAGGRMNLSVYRSLFPESGDLVRGDVSVWYLFSKTAAVEIRDFNPEAKIVVMLRNPVDQMQSMHSQALFNRDESEPDFERALELESERRLGRHMPRQTDVLHAVYYRAISEYPEQIRRYLESFDRKRVHFIVTEEMRTESARVWSSLLQFLEVDYSPIPADEVHNSNKIERSRALSALTKDIPRFLSSKYDLSKTPRSVKSAMLAVNRSIVKANMVYQERPAMSPSTRNRLLLDMEGVVAETEGLIERSLPSWRV